MKNKKKLSFLVILAVLCAAAFFFLRGPGNGSIEEVAVKKVSPYYGSIKISISTTGVVEPQNRLEIKPPIGGRIEEVFVKEGQQVEAGDILAMMSSTERAALLDAARMKDEEEMKSWQEVYKATPLIAPIDAQVIVRAVEPGQTVTTADAVLVLSDRLIISGQFDETDIASVTVGQEAIITLDAYPEVKINATVDHIAYESELVNNVTIYDVDILPIDPPRFLRSGMSASVEVIVDEHEDVMLIPSEAISKEGDDRYVIIKKDNASQPQKVSIKTGIKNERETEVISGLESGDIVLVQDKKYVQKKDSSGSNPFMPFRRR